MTSRRADSALAKLLLLLLVIVVPLACSGSDGEDPVQPDEDEQTVDAQGGTVVPDPAIPGVQVRVPAGAVSQPVTITVEEKQSDPAVQDDSQVGSIYDFGPDGTRFSVPVQLTLPLPAGFNGDPSHLLMLTTDDAGNLEVVDRSSVSGGSVIGFTDHFSPYWVSAIGGEPRTLAFEVSSLELQAGSTQQLRLEARNIAGSVIQAGTASFTSSNPSVASVNDDGVVLAQAVGTAVITAEAAGLSAEATVTVVAGSLAQLRISPSSLSLERGGQEQLSVSGLDAAGNPVASLPTVSWSSGNDAVASVSAVGVVTGGDAGETQVTASGGGVEASIPVSVAPGAPVAVEITVDAATVRAGQTVALVAQTLDDFGQVVPDAPVVSWSSADEGVATVSSSGVVTGIGLGTTGITASSQVGSDVATVTVTAGDAAFLQLNPSEVELAVGEEFTPTVVAEDAQGNAVTEGFTWSSSNENVAFVTDDGVIQAQPVLGEATVTVALGEDLSDDMLVRVIDPVPTRIRITPGSPTISSGGSVQLVTQALSQSGRVVELPGAVTYGSDNESVATVTQGGLVTGAVAGTATITATSGEFQDAIPVNVVAGSAAAMSVLTPASDVSITAGDQIQVEISAEDAAGNAIDRAPTLSSSNTEVLAVAGGSVEGRRAGTATLTVTLDAIEVTRQITVGAGAATEVVITQPTGPTQLTAGDSQGLAAEVRDAFGNVRPDAVTFSSGAPGVIRIAGATANAELVGSATVTATSGGLTDTESFTVVAGPLATIAFTTPGGGSATISVGQTLETAATGADAFGNPVTSGFGYASDNEAVATVDAGGVVTAVAIGTANISVTANGQTDQFTVTVAPGALHAVTVDPADASASSVGETVGLTALPVDFQGNAVDGVTFAWTIADEAVATLQQTTGASVQVQAVGNGSTQVTVTASKDGVDTQGSATVTVTITPASIELTPNTATLNNSGETVDLSGRVTVRDANSNVIANPTLQWGSDNEAVATVDASGVVTAVANGTATITATSGSVSATATITVDIQAASVLVDPAAAVIPVIGGTTALSATARDSEGNELQANLTWSSANEAVATVDQNGTVTGVVEGVTQVTVTSGGVSDVAEIGVAGASTLVGTAYANGSSRPTVAPGGDVTIPIVLDISRVSGDGDLGTAEATLTYDSSIFEFVSAASGLSGTADPNGATAGQVDFGFLGLSPQGFGNMVLVEVVLRVKPGATAQTTKLGLAFGDLFNTSFEAYAAPIVVTGEITISN